MTKLIERKWLNIESKASHSMVRNSIAAFASMLELKKMKTEALTTAASELTQNILRHAGSGTVILEIVESGGKKGIRASFEDKGPGIKDIEQAMQAGYSTSNTLGLGLYGVKRLVDKFTITSEVGKGTTAVIEQWQ